MFHINMRPKWQIWCSESQILNAIPRHVNGPLHHGLTFHGTFHFIVWKIDLANAPRGEKRHADTVHDSKLAVPLQERDAEISN